MFLQGDVWVRNMSVNVSFKEEVSSVIKTRCLLWCGSMMPGASLGNVTIRLKAENLMGCKNSCYSGREFMFCPPLELGGSVDVDVSGEYVTPYLLAAIALSAVSRR